MLKHCLHNLYESELRLLTTNGFSLVECIVGTGDRSKQAVRFERDTSRFKHSCSL